MSHTDITEGHGERPVVYEKNTKYLFLIEHE